MLDQKSSLRVLIVRLGAMGDILHALPAVTALRAAHPDWMLGWAVEPQWRALLAADAADCYWAPAIAGRAGQRGPLMPLVDRIHEVPAKQWGRAPLAPRTIRAILRTRRELRIPPYDVAIDLQGAVRSAIVARWSGARRIVGEAAPREPIARWWFTERIATRRTHVIEQAAEIARALSGDTLALTLPLLPRDPEAEVWADAHVPKTPFVLLSPGAGWGAKRWPLDRYSRVARVLAAQGLPVLVNASPAERTLGQALADESGAALLVPALGQLIALTRRAALAIAGDTGPLHLAAALGVPTVGIFGPTDPARNGPFHGKFAVLRHPESRRDHTRHRDPEAGLLTITPEEVVAAAAGLLAAGPRSGGRSAEGAVAHPPQSVAAGGLV